MILHHFAGRSISMVIDYSCMPYQNEFPKNEFFFASSLPLIKSSSTRQINVFRTNSFGDFILVSLFSGEYSVRSFSSL